MARPHIEPFDERTETFRRLTLPGFPRGLHYKTLSIDGDTGACSLVVRFESGWQRPAGFSYTEMELFVLDGHIEAAGGRLGGVNDAPAQSWGPGQYLWIPAGVALPALRVPRGARALLYYNYGEPSFAASAEDHPFARRADLVSVNAYDDLQWKVGLRNPAVAPGCVSKVLRVDPVTKGYTFLYCMTPNYWQDNISYHDCAEESYHIWGTSWMMQFGELPTGGYFWRPPYINHGAFASKLGCLALGRTDCNLVNYFHFNPWTDIEQNRQRVVDKVAAEAPALFRWEATPDGHNHPVGTHTHADGVTHAHAHEGAHAHGRAR
jgi:hypothetical protein